MKINELHDTYNVYPEYKDFYLSYQYDRKLDTWKFLGYRCTKCGKIFKKDKTVPNHYKNCKIINTNRRYKLNEIDSDAIVLDKNRELWHPTDINL